MNYNKLHYRRKQKKLTQKEVADKIGISSGGYQKIEYGGNPTIKVLEAISGVLDVPMAYWWEEETLTFREPDVDYEKALIKENIKLKEQISRDQRTIDRLLDQLEKIEKKQTQSKAASCG